MKPHSRLWVPLIVLFAGLVLYLYNIDGWLIADDEGTDLYEIWRISEGDIAGVDVITEQLPVFLLGGVGLGLLSDFNVAVLRGASAVLVLGSAWLVMLIGSELWSRRVGLYGMIIYLLNHLVYTQARLFRPDPWMLAFSVLGLYLFVVAQRKGAWYLPLCGVAYAAATLCKLFAVLPLAGSLLYLVYRLITRQATLRRSMRDGTLVLVPFLLLTIGSIWAFYPPGSAYYGSVLGQHWKLGSELGLLGRFWKGLAVLALFFVQNLAFLFSVSLLHRRAFNHSAGVAILTCQLPTGLAYLVLSRPLYDRYWLYLVPVFSLLLGSLIDRVLGWIGRHARKRRLLVNVSMVVMLGLCVAQSFSVILGQATRHEEDTLALASYIADHTSADDLVLSDYATLNFHARRPSVPQASVIARGRIVGGFITGEMLIGEIEARDVKMVVLHVPGGTRAPQHLVHLHDYEAFYAYLNERFCLVDTFDRAGQIFDIYQTCSGR